MNYIDWQINFKKKKNGISIRKRANESKLTFSASTE